MIEFLLQPWPWYFSGPMIALVLFLLLWTGKSFGMSSNLRTLCAAMGAGKKVSFFQFDWKAQRWNLVVASGAILGGFIAANYLSSSTAVAISPETIAQLNECLFAKLCVILGTFFNFLTIKRYIRKKND